MPNGNLANVPQSIDDGVLLYQAETALMKLAERALLPSGLSAPQMLLLGALYHDGRALVPRRLRNSMVVEAQSLTGIMDRLENAGLAKRLNHPSDRRKILLEITAKGRTKYEQAAPPCDEQVEAYFKPLTETDRTRLRTILMKLRREAYADLDLRHDKAYPPAS